MDGLNELFKLWSQTCMLGRESGTPFDASAFAADFVEKGNGHEDLYKIFWNM